MCEIPKYPVKKTELCWSITYISPICLWQNFAISLFVRVKNLGSGHYMLFIYYQKFANVGILMTFKWFFHSLIINHYAYLSCHYIYVALYITRNLQMLIYLWPSKDLFIIHKDIHSCDMELIVTLCINMHRMIIASTMTRTFIHMELIWVNQVY